MTTNTVWKLMTAAALASLMACNSTDATDSGNGGVQASGDVTTDLQTIANAVQRMPVQKQDDFATTTADGSVQLKVADDLWDAEDCAEIAGQEHITVCSSTIGEYFSNDTTYNFQADGVTPLVDEGLSGSSVSVSRTHYKDDLYESYGSLRVASSYSFATNGDNEVSDFNFSMTGTGSGWVNYYQDGVKLEMPSMSFSFDDSGFKVQYDISLMDGAYTTVLKVEQGLDDVDSEVSESTTAVMGEGDLLDKSGTKVGLFRLMLDESVVILDTEGNVIQAADGADAATEEVASAK